MKKSIILLALVQFTFGFYNAQNTKVSDPNPVNPFDFLDDKSVYIGQTLRFLVSYSRENKTSPNAQERYESSDGKYFDYLCKCMKQDPTKAVTYKWSNSKTFELVEGGFKKINVKIPEDFFSLNGDGKMKGSYSDGYLIIDIYIESEYSYKLVDIKRFKR